MPRFSGLICVGLVLACGGRSSRTDRTRAGAGGGLAEAGAPENGAAANASARGGSEAFGGTRGGGAPSGSGGSGATTSGARAGKGGRGGAAAGQENNAGERDCGELIDDMEDGSGRICTGSGRIGVWYAFNDERGQQAPAPTTPGVPIAVSVLGAERADSVHAIHTSGDGFSAWGAGVGLDLDYDGTTYSTYDASAYSGITFWVRGEGRRPVGPDLPSYLFTAAVLPTLSFRVSDESSTYHDWGGTSPSKGFGPTAGIEPEEDFNQYFVPFRTLRAKNPNFEPGRLTNLQFLTTAMPFDFWVDDIAFYTGVANCCSPGCGDAVAFGDIRLAQRVLLGAGVATEPTTSVVSCETACMVSAFTTSNTTVSSLTGVECLAPLAAASLAGSTLGEVSALAGLPHLATLDVSSNAIQDVAPLASLGRLHTLDVSQNPLTRIDALGAAPRLAFLRANADALTELHVDAGFAALSWLEIRDNPLSALTLVKLPRLTFLDARSGKLTTLELALTGLTTLRLDGNSLTHVELDTPALTELSVNQNQLADLDAVRGAPALTTLNADDNPLVDVSALATLPALASLSLAHTPITSAALGALRNAPLGFLGLTGTAVDDLSALAGVKFGAQASGLPLVIALEGTNVTDLSPLVRNATVVSGVIYLSGTPFDCVEQAENLAALAARGVGITGRCAPGSP
jgi:hypothetical protein